MCERFHLNGIYFDKEDVNGTSLEDMTLMPKLEQNLGPVRFGGQNLTMKQCWDQTEAIKNPNVVVGTKLSGT